MKNDKKVWMSIVGISLAFWVFAGVCHGATYYVSPSGNGSDGNSWETAFATIPPALNAASAGDSIWTASGTFYGQFILPDGVAVYGGFRGTEQTDEFHLRDPESNKCIVTLDRPTSIKRAMFTGSDGSILDGFHIRDTLTAIYCENARMIIRNCTIVNNNNEVGWVPNAAGGLGIVDSTVTLTNCRIVENTSSGVSIRSSSVTFRHCQIVGNQSVGGGAGLIAQQGSIVQMEDCLIARNRASGENSGGGGLAVSSGARVYLRHCTFRHNVAGGYDEEEQEPLGHSIYQTVGGAHNLPGTHVELTNCIVWDTFGPKHYLTDIKYVFVNSNVIGLISTPTIVNQNSISTDPLFVDPDNGNYRLKANSPCVDSGTETSLLTDLDGNPRPVDVPGIPNNPTAYDMGCYEHQLPVGDLNGDGKVDAKDLLIFQGQWMEASSD